ncbi:neutral/alkaline non-lysosomal ceramidase N-terminal domain-containing protein [Kribbella sp. CA-294648]|uniref:neutral/alkaline non-lysosomal ceramidase N-terminal domain-containing protein n=1 Tax=Kribbella sp. CA-294648 TaxID=3239948 RepID=UPI003D8FEA25
MSELLLAAASLDVTPPPGHRLDGYAAREGVATGTADLLRATMIWLSTADSPGVLWLSLDAIAVGTSLVAELSAAAGAAAGIPPECVLVCASHTHSAPAGWTGQIHPVIPAEREPVLYESLTAAVTSAPLERRPVRASWRSIEVVGVGTNRHRRNGPHDNTAGVLTLHSVADGTLAAVLLDFACHPTTYGPENLLYSADWPGATRKALAHLSTASASLGGPALPPGPVVGFLQGAAGDVSPRFTRQGRDAREVERLGGLLAARVAEALTEPGLELPAVAPAIRRTTVTLKVRDFPTPAELEAMVATAEADLHGGIDHPAQRIAQTRLDGARGQAQMAAANLPPALDLPISVVKLGEVAWVHLPVELFASHGCYLQADSPHPITRVIGYTDGYFGYVVDPDAAHHGTYEALITYFDQPTTGELLKAAVKVLAE